MAKAKKQPFNVSDFLSKMDGGRTLQTFRKNQKVFAQGEPADAVRSRSASRRSRARRLSSRYTDRVTFSARAA